MSPLVDLHQLRELAATEVAPGDSLLPHFLDTFACDARATLEHMLAKAHVGDPRLLAGDAQRLRRGSASIGALRLAQELAEIERCARAGAVRDVEARVTRALELLYATCDAILRHFPTIANRPAGAP